MITVKSVALQEQTTYALRICYWEFSPQGRHQWLQRLAFRVLRKLNAVRWPMVAETKIVRVPATGELLQRVEDSKYETTTQGLEPFELLIGPEQYDKIMNTKDVIGSYIEVITEYKWGSRHPEYVEHKICGLLVRIIPWMDGILVLPKTHKRKEIEQEYPKDIRRIRRTHRTETE